MTELCDEDEVLNFLRMHFLHRLDALSLLDGSADAIELVKMLHATVSGESVALKNDSINKARLIRDIVARELNGVFPASFRLHGNSGWPMDISAIWLHFSHTRLRSSTPPKRV